MKRIYISLPFMAFFFVAGVHAGERYIDPIQKKIDEQHKVLIQKYKGSCKAKNKVGCQIEAAERADETVPGRGTSAYNKSTYGNLSKAQAKAKLKELVSLYDKVDGQSKASWDGKVEKWMVESEVRWLMSQKLNQPAPDIISAKMYLGVPLR
ncbi:hypothetical protein ABNL11_004978 [Klebsiella pneumoniae]|uniref:hypothetical protein n=1 Tax=Klebsiella pneumoniae TaxID=573 RepID=UPI0018A405AA|nr:hypothetical protein [Klebsiella pneumoniae]MDE8392907.1 hypothetical protein [Klebsiella pneumoniae]BBW89490.1 hypothetical protein THOKLE017_P30270 [Klebsiella pneumoniae]HBU8764000.1 hypothetical protein [Klebsiella pneumoniae]